MLPITKKFETTARKVDSMLLLNKLSSFLAKPHKDQTHWWRVIQMCPELRFYLIQDVIIITQKTVASSCRALQLLYRDVTISRIY